MLAALEMMEERARPGLPPAHVGLQAGSVVFQGGDYFGRTVNVAAGIDGCARLGEVLISQDVVEASDIREVVFTEIEPVELKSISHSGTTSRADASTVTGDTMMGADRWPRTS